MFVQTTVQVSAFYRANLTEMELAKVAALAPKRSPTPQENHSSRHHSTIPGTGIMTPRLKTSTPGVDAPSAVSRSRSSGRMSPPPNPRGTQSSETDQRPTSAAQHETRPAPPRPMQYQGGLAAAFAGPSRGPFSEAAALPRQPLSRAPPPLTIPIPTTLAYSNLSPSHFNGTQRRAHVVALHPRSASESASGATASAMELSEFALPTWQVPAAGQAQVLGGTAEAGFPAALETTDDLVRYLEHRTRLTAQNTDSDFM